MVRFLKSIFGASILLMATLLIAGSCKGAGTGGDDKRPEFKIKSIMLWGNNITKAKNCEVRATSKIRRLEVVVDGVETYKVAWNAGAKSGEITAENYKADEDIELPRGEFILEIILTADSRKPYKHSINVKHTAPSTDVKVRVKTKESPVFVETTGEYPALTKVGEADIELEAEVPMKDAKVGDVALTLTEDKKKATGKIKAGNHKVTATFEEYKDFELSFELKVVTGDLLIKATRAVISSGKGNTVPYDLTLGDNNIYEELALSDIPFSVVKLDMEFDYPISKAQIVRCKDERTEVYHLTPHDEEWKKGGIFSGRVAKVVELSSSGGNKFDTITLENVKDGKYTEYLIVGKGAVEYDIQFSADGRVPVTYTVKIKNKNETCFQFGQPSGLTIINTVDFSGLGLHNIMDWVGHLKTPITNVPNKDLILNRADLQYMGDKVKFFVAAKIAEIKPKGFEDFHFFYNISKDIRGEVCHDFTRVYSVRNKELTNRLNVIKFDPKEEYVDAFIASDHKFLPLQISPWSTSSKWQCRVPKGFFVDKLSLGEEGKFADAFHLRNQSVIFGEQNEGGNHISGKELMVSKKQKYLSWVDGSEETDDNMLKGAISNKIAERDIFKLTPIFEEDYSKIFSEITTKISVKDGEDFVEKALITNDPSKWDDKPYIVLGAKDEFLPKIDAVPDKDLTKLEDLSDLFLFEAGTNVAKNVYKVEVECTLLDGTKEWFDFIISFKDEFRQETFAINKANDGMTFGLPTYFGGNNVVKLEPDMIRELKNMNFVR